MLTQIKALLNNPQRPQSLPGVKPIQKLSETGLALICGGRSKEDDEPVTR